MWSRRKSRSVKRISFLFAVRYIDVVLFGRLIQRCFYLIRCFFFLNFIGFDGFFGRTSLSHRGRRSAVIQVKWPVNINLPVFNVSTVEARGRRNRSRLLGDRRHRCYDWCCRSDIAFNAPVEVPVEVPGENFRVGWERRRWWPRRRWFSVLRPPPCVVIKVESSAREWTRVHD